jgi:hypothetical protein
MDKHAARQGDDIIHSRQTATAYRRQRTHANQRSSYGSHTGNNRTHRGVDPFDEEDGARWHAFKQSLTLNAPRKG